ncbi:MAG TPA: histidinol-phosphate transaminase [Gemmatimonadales bacterium]
MERRDFVRTGLALGTIGVTGLPTVERTWRSAAAAADPLRLDSNENPLGLAPLARRAVIDGIPEGNRYPDAAHNDLIDALAAKHGVAPASVVIGAGSTDVLRMLVQATAGPGARIVVADPTFEDVPSYAEPFGFQVERVPLTSTYAHDIDRMRTVAHASTAPTLVFLCNPNNPTGTLTSCAAIDEWAAEAPDHVRFIIDEAYFEYVDDPGYWTSVPWIASRPNVVVVRTFSKIHGMAGMRAGYGIAHPDTAAKLRVHQGRNNVGYLTLVAALASLRDRDLVARGTASNTRARAILTDALAALAVEHIPSHTNFLMHRITGDLRTYIDRMRQAGARVGRPFPPLTGFNRVSLGLPEEMERFAALLHDFRRQNWI